ncbi:hypothetical protein F0U62_28590 [Cystobacter fuscus]|uniref:hypothetical protein n=1 Tax=Cystobacter fuscus TaxID=43 RepID=UPI002B28A9A1|nr:hypothetical protein F0U62_28590 [Cystobacter fuscus]
MQCQECGEIARDVALRYCENCGAKMPAPPPGVRRTGARPALPAERSAAPARAALPGDETDEQPEIAPVRRVAREPEHAEPEAPRGPPYDGPIWLAHVPAHSPSVLGVGLLAVALVLSILPFFADVGPLWSLVTLAGGWLVVARELRAVGERHALVDWVPDSLLHPAVPALYAVVVVVLAIRMLGVGITPVLWAGGAALIGFDQYRKVYVGEDGWSRFFDPRQLRVGMAPVALAGVALCLLSLFLSWESRPTSAAVRGSSGGAPQLRVMDQTPASSDVVYNLLDMPHDAGWDQPLSVFVALLLVGVLGLMALRPEVPRPEALRFAPLGVLVVCLAWMIFNGVLSWGPVLFLVGLVATGFVSVYGSFSFSREA